MPHVKAASGQGRVALDNGVDVFESSFLNVDVTLPKAAAALAAGTIVKLDSAAPPSRPQAPLAGALQLVEVWGHSLAQAGPPALPRDQDSYAEKVAKALGAVRLNNRAIGGQVSCWPTAGTTGDGGSGWVLQQARRPGSQAYGTWQAHPETAQAPYVSRAQLIIDHAAFNDLAALGPATPRPMQEAHRTRWSRSCACALWEAKDPAGAVPAAPWVETGTFNGLAATNANSGSAIRYTTAVGDKKQFTIPADAPAGRVWAFGFFMNAQQDVTIGVKINGVAQPDVRLQGSVLCDQNVAGKHQAVTLRFGAGGTSLSSLDFPAKQLGAGDVIEFTLKVQNIAGSSMSVDFAQIEADPLDGPVIAVLLNHKPTSYTLWNAWAHGAQMNDAAVDTWNAALAAVAAEFPNRMLLVDMGALSTKDPTLTGTPPPGDNVHWNQKGHGLTADSASAAILRSGLITSRVLTRPVVDPDPFFKPFGTYGFPAYLNSWASYPSSLVDVTGVHRDLQGRTYLRGSITKTTGAPGDHIVNLNPGYRRARLTDSNGIPIYNGSTWSTSAICRTDSTGDVFYILGGSIAANNSNILKHDWFANA